MPIKNTYEKYSIITKMLHIIVILAVSTQVYLINRRKFFPKDSAERLQYMLLHKSVGFTALFVILAFIIWRLFNVKPLFPKSMHLWEIVGAKINHFLLYIGLLIMPISGMLMSMASGNGLAWFGVHIPNIIGTNYNAAEIYANIHSYTAYVLLVLITLHVLAALKHQFINKDGVLRRIFF